MDISTVMILTQSFSFGTYILSSLQLPYQHPSRKYSILSCILRYSSDGTSNHSLKKTVHILKKKQTIGLKDIPSKLQIAVRKRKHHNNKFNLKFTILFPYFFLNYLFLKRCIHGSCALPRSLVRPSCSFRNPRLHARSRV